MKNAKIMVLIIILTVIMFMSLLTEPAGSVKSGQITLKNGEVVQCPGGIGLTNSLIDITQEHLSCRKNPKDLGQPIINFRENNGRWVKLIDIMEIHFEK